MRRFAGGAGQAADLAVRLACDPEEPTTLSLASARGLGDAAVLIALRQNTAYLQREVAHRVRMKFAAKLKFLADDSFEEASHIDALLRRRGLLNEPEAA